VQELCLSVLVFRENQRRQEERIQGALRAAVAGRWADPAKTWPDIFGKPPAPDAGSAFPSADADMSGFRWEKPDEERMAAELEQLMHGARVSLREEGGDGPPPVPPPPAEPPVALRPGTRPPAPVPGDPGSLEWG
jgi:hypothetical protein